MGMPGRLRGRGGHWRGIERVIRQGDGHLRQPSTVFASKGPKVWGGEEEGEEGQGLGFFLFFSFGLGGALRACFYMWSLLSMN